MPAAPGLDVAIVGMACVLPGAPDLAAYAANLDAGVDAIGEVPAGRWPASFYDPDSDDVDRIYCRRGGFVDEFATFDPLRWGVPPTAVEGIDPDQLLALEVAARALADAGYESRPLPRERTGVILGRGGYVGIGQTRLLQAVRTAEELAASLRALVPGISAEAVERVRREYRERVPGLGPDTMIGLVPNLAASRIANRLDLHGPAYTVDAACASALVAVDRACQDLAGGRSDVVVAGGVHLAQDVTFWSVFCQLGAMSRSGTIRPFDDRADGLLAGEGVGAVVLKRRADAERDGDRVYAVVRGTGVSSDGRATSALVPNPGSQVLAIRRAWEAAGLDPTAPGALGLLEAHGTATQAGDRAEAEAVAAAFGAPDGRPRPVIGSVKSMIGHAMPAAGIAGLVKAALAVHHGRLYPTLHCEEPRPELERTRFRTLAASEPWEDPDGPRRAGVNAFGFGGINAHVVLEDPGPRGPARRVRSRAGTVAAPCLMAAADDPAALLAALDAGRAEPGAGTCRLALLDPTPERVARAREVVARGTSFRDRAGTLTFAAPGLLTGGGRIAFLFPGVDDLSDPVVDEVAAAFDRVPPEPAPGEDLVELGARVLVASRLLLEVLEEDLGLEADVLAGHSIGEWTALLAAGAIPWEAADVLLATLDPEILVLPDVAFAAAGCGVERLAPVLAGEAEVHVALDNCTRQTVLCGPDAAIRAAVERLRSDGILCQVLDFRSGFHTPLFAPHVGPVREILDRIPFERPRREAWSATTCAPFPNDPDRLREAFLEHLVRPVRFRELVRSLHAADVRAFVQVGDGRLCGFVDDVLADDPHLAIPTAARRRGGLDQLRRVAACLWAEGASIRWERLLEPVGGSTNGASGGRRRLTLSTPLAVVSTPLAGIDAGPALPDGAGDDPVLAEFARTDRALAEARRAVLAAWDRRRLDREVRIRRTLSLESCPWLRDHSFFPIPPDWPHPEDGYPTVPLTMSLEMLLEAAREAAPDRVVVGLEEVRAHRWLAVEEPVEVEVVARREGERVRVAIEGHVDGIAVLAERWPEPPAADRSPIPDERPLATSPTEMYTDGTMFHGPAYRGVVELRSIGSDGIRGVVERLPAEGSLLDAAGQMIGFWTRLNTDRDRLAIPVLVDSIEMFGPEPPVGTRLEVTGRVRTMGSWRVRSDIDVHADGRTWARIRGWITRRTKNDPWMWETMKAPQSNPLARPHPALPAVVWLPPLEARSTRDYFSRIYLRGDALREYRTHRPRAQIDWLAGRIAAKDAVRRVLWERGHGPLWPIQIDVERGPGGAPVVRVPEGSDVRVSIAHKAGAAVAAAAVGRSVGVDLERVEPRKESFDRAAFTEAERALLPADDRDAWRARLWAAKEAAAKMAGTGLGGAPGRWPVERVDGDAVVVAGHRVETARDGEWILAWIEEG